jgi:hypothetical protein
LAYFYGLGKCLLLLGCFEACHIIDKKGNLVYNNYLEEFEPYAVSKELLGASILLETHVSNSLSHSLLSPSLRNLTYGERTLCVWIAEG